VLESQEDAGQVKAHSAVFSMGSDGGRGSSKDRWDEKGRD
jgi:hypothetical protein